MKYKIVDEDTLDVFEAKVDKLLADGWSLYGNPFMGNDQCYCQALVLYEPQTGYTQLEIAMKQPLGTPEEIIAAVNSSAFDEHLMNVGPA